MSYEEIILKVSDDTGFPKHFVDRVYKSYWKAVKEYVSSLPLKEELTDLEFSELRPNVNIPSLGKLYITLDRYRTLKNVNQKLLNNKD